MKITFTLIFALFVNVALAQNGSTGIFNNSTDIGNPKYPGSDVFNKTDQSYTISGSGYNIWFGRDEFHYSYNTLKGDFILTANFEFTGKGTEPHRKTGWMVRASANDNSPQVSAVFHGNGLTALQWRKSAGEEMTESGNEIVASGSGYQILQLERSGKVFFMRAARYGEPFETIGTFEANGLPDEVLAGLFVCSHNSDVTEEVKVWNVRIDKPVSDDYNPGSQGWLGCRLEKMNVFDGKRIIIYEKPSRFEAPNWMPDGKKLLFNMDGLLWKIPVTGGEPEKLNTGTADKNNNDHGISWDGKLLAISSSPQGGSGSSVYYLPVKGGEPKKISDKSPSYWHGWALNNKEVIYVGLREGQEGYNLYRNSINGGEEVQLTFVKKDERADGCEYSPDGKYIYYNGSHTGNMQIWRIKPDGTGSEQITFDENNNWFPHISPDGKWLVFIAFPPDIELNAHPSYKRVTLRLMPASGGPSKVIAYLYGGQGTINVPSWSPDSKQIAFVSNSGKY